MTLTFDPKGASEGVECGCRRHPTPTITIVSYEEPYTGDIYIIMNPHTSTVCGFNWSKQLAEYKAVEKGGRGFVPGIKQLMHFVYYESITDVMPTTRD